MAEGKKTLVRLATALFIGILCFAIPGGFPAAASSGNLEDATATSFSPLFWTVIIVGGCITLTLSYVSWKKYKAETKEKRGKSS